MIVYINNDPNRPGWKYTHIPQTCLKLEGMAYIPVPFGFDPTQPIALRNGKITNALDSSLLVLVVNYGNRIVGYEGPPEGFLAIWNRPDIPDGAAALIAKMGEVSYLKLDNGQKLVYNYYDLIN